jgi:peptide/nickel transport system substrate-binding protein
VSRPVFKKDFIGLGPNKVAGVKRNGEFIDEVTVQKSDNQKIKFRFYRTSADLITAFKLGEVDEIWGLTSLSALSNWEKIEIIPKLNFDIYSAVFFNTADASLANKSFRQALIYAIPGKPAGDKRALSPISPLSFAYNPGVKPYETNPQLAADLLKESLAGGAPPAIELTTTLPFLDQAEEIANAWNQIGVKTDVKVAAAVPENFQTLLVGQERPADPDQYSLWHSTQKSNITRYSSPKIDKLLEDGRRTMNENKRLEIYRDFQRFLVEDSPAAFLEHLTTYNIRRK